MTKNTREIRDVYGYNNNDGSFMLAVSTIDENGDLAENLYFTLRRTDGVANLAAKNLLSWFDGKFVARAFDGAGWCD